MNGTFLMGKKAVIPPFLHQMRPCFSLLNGLKNKFALNLTLIKSNSVKFAYIHKDVIMDEKLIFEINLHMNEWELTSFGLHKNSG